MKYIALLRGINVGQNKRVNMKELRQFFENLGYFNVATYINSGNVIFESRQKLNYEKIEVALAKKFGLHIPVLIKTLREMQKIAKAIPANWQNDTTQRTDVAYLFAKIDNKSLVKELPLKRDYIDVRYIRGALFWNVKRKNYNKSHLNKLISHKLYKFMTIRNINTARYLASV